MLLGMLLPAVGSPQDADSRVIVPALTPVPVRLDAEISSRQNRTGDRFPITVSEDVRIEGALVIPAGSAGEGQVVHAARPGAGGKPGELILAARYVRVGDIEVRLRSFSLGASGADRSETALLTSFVAGPFAMFVRGGAVVVPRDTPGMAKTAIEFRLPAVAESTAPTASQTVDNEGEEDEKK